MNWGQGPPKVKKFKDYLKGRDRGLPENLLVHSPNGYGGQGGARPKAGASCRSPMCVQGAEVEHPGLKTVPTSKPSPPSVPGRAAEGDSHPWVPGFGLAQSWLLLSCRAWTNGWKISPCNSAFQIKKSLKWGGLHSSSCISPSGSLRSRLGGNSGSGGTKRLKADMLCIF